MATITQFGKKKNRGWCIGSLPMPDGTKRTYKEFGRHAFKVIIEKWKEEKAAMEKAMALAQEA